jgi:PAS domain S-box-containing protein
MKLDSTLASFAVKECARRGVLWIGVLLIAGIAALAAYGIVRSYRATISDTGRELDSHARLIAEQTARGVQAVDVVLRHLSEQYRQGTIASRSAQDLGDYLQEQSVALVQVHGIGLFDAAGNVRAGSAVVQAQPAPLNISAWPIYQTLRADRDAGLFMRSAFQNPVDGQWVIFMGRRLESAAGEFGGVVAAGLRVDYYQQFYRDVRPAEGMGIALLHQSGNLLARHPEVAGALGKRYPLLDELVAAYELARPEPTRRVSPVDGIERFGAVAQVPGYPLTVVVTLDTAVALAPWRAQATGTALRTLALSVFAALLLALVIRQFKRLHAARAALEADIEARKRAEEALRQSEERFALAVAGSNDGIIDWDMVKDRMYLSERAMRILDIEGGPSVRPREQWRALIEYHPDDAAQVKEELRKYLEGPAVVRDAAYRIRLRNGAYRWIRHRNMCVRDSNGRAVRLAGSVSDIDAYKRAEAALRESQERYQLAVAGSNVGLWDWDLLTDTVFLSPRAQEFLGHQPGEQVRSRRAWIEIANYHPDDINAVRAATAAHLRGATECFEIECRMRHADGTWHWYRPRGVALRDAQGKPYRVAGSIEDITRRKNSEAERTRLEGQLRQAQKLEAIGTLAGGIAHDFNNILAAILGYGEMAQKHAAEGTALRRHIDAVLNAGARAKSLVERILAFSRSGMGERVAVHVQAVVEEALELIAASLPPGVRLERRLSVGGAAVMGDPTQVHQVVMNLCANAIQAMKGKGALTVSLERMTLTALSVTTNTLPAGDYLRLAVSDTGGGIAPHVLERIFDPFFTTKEVGVGTGLGLSLVHGIVTDLGGGIDVASELGTGSTFTVYLPWQGAATAPGRIDESVPAGNGETILLVDDEEALIALGEEMIAALGYEPVGYASSAAALAAFRAEPDRYDAVLSDETMPGMTGSELAREIRKIRGDMPVVLMSGLVTPALAARAREIGINDVLAKPLVSGDIARTLAWALRAGALGMRQ